MYCFPAGLPLSIPVSPLEPYGDHTGAELSGNFTISVNGATITLQSQITGLDPSSLGSVALHQGSLCTDIGDQVASPITGETPWDGLPEFEADSSGAAEVSAVVTGFPLSSITGRTLVVRDAAGEMMACGSTRWAAGMCALHINNAWGWAVTCASGGLMCMHAKGLVRMGLCYKLRLVKWNAGVSMDRTDEDSFIPIPQLIHHRSKC